MVLGTLFGGRFRADPDLSINFDGTLSLWWTKIAIGISAVYFRPVASGPTVPGRTAVPAWLPA